MQIPTNKENILGYQDLVKEDTSFPESRSDFDALSGSSSVPK